MDSFFVRSTVKYYLADRMVEEAHAAHAKAKENAGREHKK